MELLSLAVLYRLTCLALHETKKVCTHDVFCSQEVHEEGKLPNVLESLKAILQTPIKPFILVDHSGLSVPEAHAPAPNPHPDDLPSQLTKVIGKGRIIQTLSLVFL